MVMVKTAVPFEKIVAFFLAHVLPSITERVFVPVYTVPPAHSADAAEQDSAKSKQACRLPVIDWRQGENAGQYGVPQEHDCRAEKRRRRQKHQRPQGILKEFFHFDPPIYFTVAVNGFKGQWDRLPLGFPTTTITANIVNTRTVPTAHKSVSLIFAKMLFIFILLTYADK